MSDYGICETPECNLHYAKFKDLLTWLDDHPNHNQKPPDEYMAVFQKNPLDCAECHNSIVKTTDPQTPDANRFIKAIDILRDRGVLEWP